MKNNLVFVEGTARYKIGSATVFKYVNVPNFYISKYALTYKAVRDVIKECFSGITDEKTLILMSAAPESIYSRLIKSIDAEEFQWHYENKPIVNINWYEAIEICNWLSRLSLLSPYYNVDGENVTINLSAAGYRLLTEAEWEYAARGGINQDAFKYSGSDNPSEVAWYERSQGTIRSVGRLKPNSLGLYDMSGNVWEWCFDDSKNYNEPVRITKGGSCHSKEFQLNPKNTIATESERSYSDVGIRIGKSIPEEPCKVLRGGSYLVDESYCRCYYRNHFPPYVNKKTIGLRLCANAN